MRRTLTTLATATLLSSAAHAVPTQWTVASGGNGHWYEFFPETVVAEVAYVLAAGETYQGMTGYLATLTSAAENQFASLTVAQGNTAWLGATDNGVEGQWVWRSGPEAGQTLTYLPWRPSEPNNCCGGENYLQTNYDYNTALWNDHGGPGNLNARYGYLVEFSAAVPEPASLGLMAAGLALLAGVARRRTR